MKFPLLFQLTLPRKLILANGIFWLIFVIYFAAESHPYIPHKPAFEEELPGYTYFGRALSIEAEYMGLFLKVTRLVQWPSFFVTRPFFWYFNSRGIVVDHLYLGISVGGYYLILVCSVSFLQWYLIGRFVDWVKRRLTMKADGADTNR